MVGVGKSYVLFMKYPFPVEFIVRALIVSIRVGVITVGGEGTRSSLNRVKRHWLDLS